MEATSSILLRLPRELRDEVFFIFFNSTRLTFGVRKEHYHERDRSRKTKPAANSLAILRVCHQISAETRDIWVGRVTFNYESAKAFMSNMSAVPQQLVSQMRHMRISNHSGQWLQSDGVNETTIYHMSTLLKLFPSLQLDILTFIRGCVHGVAASQHVDFFLENGQGWRELRLITKDSEMFTWAYHHDDEPLHPGDWKAAILERDGADSGSTVTLFQAVKNNVPGGTVNMTSDVLVDETKLPHLTDPDTLFESAWEDRPIMVIVKRGKDVDIVERRDIAFEPLWWEPDEHVLDFKGNSTWGDFLELYEEACFKEHDWFPEEEFDVYNDVDDIVWPHDGIVALNWRPRRPGSGSDPSESNSTEESGDQDDAVQV